MAKILVVEDDPGVLENVAQLLESLNHVVDKATDGTYALDLLCLSGYDMVILDWDIPKQSGLEVCRKYRADSGKAPVLMLTGKNAVDQKEQAFDIGADDYLTKPFEGRELAARVRALLRRPHTLRTDALVAGHVTLEPASRSVSVNGASTKLLPKELALLEFLMRHPNQVFSADALLTRVWTAESDASPDTVRKNITRLRQKIERAEFPALIHTVFGLGYQLIPPQSSPHE
jgi:DNA-binding response OmpR family regulator